MTGNVLHLGLDLLADGPVDVRFGNHRIAVIDVEGVVYAIDNLCPHAGELLSNGHVQGVNVECALHNARFHIPTGKCLNGPGSDLSTFPVRVTRDYILVDCGLDAISIPDKQQA